MRKNIIQFIVLFGTISIYGQTGIGTVLPDRNAILDVVSTDKGVLIPRMKLTGEGDINTIPGGNYTDGLTVFNTGTTNFEAGFYWSQTIVKTMHFSAFSFQLLKMFTFDIWNINAQMDIVSLV